jgi:type IV secretory pathway VirB10-like protein
MQINKLVFGGLIIGCLGAAGVGGYLANRLNQPAPVTAATPAEPAGTNTVTASEGVVAPATEPAPSAAPAAAPPARQAAPAAPRRAEPAPAPAPRRTPEAPRQATTRPVPAAEPAPSAAATAAPQAPAAAGSSMWETRPAVQADAPEPSAPEPEPVADPTPEFVELVVPADAVIGLQLETTVSSDRARVEDAVEARVTRDVRVGGRVAIPAGALVHGTVTEVERGGKVRERARLGIRFHTIVLASGDKLTLRTDAITREGASPGRESAAKIGGAAVGGAILGAILGGGKGAAIGAGVGAGGGTAAVMAGERNVVTVPAGSTVSVRMRQPVTVTVEKE